MEGKERQMNDSGGNGNNFEKSQKEAPSGGLSGKFGACRTLYIRRAFYLVASFD